MEYTTLSKVYMLRTHLVCQQIMVFRRFNRGNYLRPVNRIKHVVDNQFATALDTNVDTTLVFASDTPDLATAAEVETGAVIRSIFLAIEVVNTGATGVLANAYFMIFKNPGGNLTFPKPNVVGTDDNKRYVFHQEMLMLQMVDNSNPRTLFKGVLKLPRHLQRFGPNDTLIARVFSPGVELTGCVQCHYKELR